DSNIYLVDRDNMGKFNAAGNTNIYQELSGALPGGEWAMPAYFNGMLYYGGVNEPLRAFAFSNARLIATAASATSESYSYPGTTPSISAAGQNNAIVWTIEAADEGVLHAYNAANLSVELYNSEEAPNGRDSFADNKFVTPTIANGKVYVGTPDSVAVFGLLTSAPSESAQARTSSNLHSMRPSRMLGPVGCGGAPPHAMKTKPAPVPRSPVAAAAHVHSSELAALMR
ncbi:MAG TPA: hypothetical protein VMT64_09135, partial [Candidatus Binataceae bacterium]|nr:hypothetical protein [Candidatus Binataceae bacterium]